jgi:hypothetical protein
MAVRMAFTFENLDVYKRVLRFATGIEALLSKQSFSVNRGFTDQLSRASLSVPQREFQATTIKALVGGKVKFHGVIPCEERCGKNPEKPNLT